MSNETIRQTTTKRRTRARSAKHNPVYRRQTGRGELRRDGKPLIFGWGSHLTRSQKQRIQQRALYSFFGVILVLVVGVFTFGVIQQNIIIPNQTIVSVNSANIPQDTFRKLYAYNTQTLWNTVQYELRQQRALQTKVQAGDKAAITQSTILVQQYQTDSANFKQDLVAQSTISQLTEDQLIRSGAKAFEQSDPKAKAQLEPSAKAISDQLNTFKAAFPQTEKYADFLSKNSLSENDVRDAITVSLRRTMMQKYLAARLVSPTKQAHIRRIETNTAAIGQKVLTLLKKPNADWTALAKQYSLDPDTNKVGGDVGWIAVGTNDAAIENWTFATGRKVNDLSGVIKDAAGTYDVVQVLAFDPSRAIPDTQLQTIQTNALDHWLSGQRVAPGTHISTPNQDMLSATRNVPALPSFSVTLPNENPQPTAVSRAGP